MANNLRSLSKDERFFYDHAGYSYDPKTETAQQGRIRCALSLAEAEDAAQRLDWRYEWTNDWGVGSHREYFGKDSAYADREPDTCEFCQLFDADGEVLETLGCVDDASTEYRRVIEAELASEALYRMRRADPFWDVPAPAEEPTDEYERRTRG